MKIGERTDFLETKTHEIIEGVFITINGLPLGFDEQIEEDIPSPVPPNKPLISSDGQIIYRNRKQKIVETEPDTDNISYKAACKIANRRQSAWTVLNGTRTDSSLVWAAKKESFSTIGEFYQAIYDEIIASGFGAGKILQLVMAIQSISGMSKDQIERAKQAFLSGEASET